MAAVVSPEMPGAVQMNRTGARKSAPIFLPREHGSWSLALEPLALGLIVAPSAAGLALAVAAASAFFARRPAKAAFADAARRSPDSRRAAALLAFCAVAGAAEAAGLGHFRGLWPILLAAPFGALFLSLDLRSGARAAAAELAGGATFALLPAAFATLAGWAPKYALALAAIMVARTVPTVIAVRASIRLKKLQEKNRLAPAASAAAAFLLLLALASLSFVPWGVVALSALLLARAPVLTSRWAMGFSARRIGMAEALIGVLYIAGAFLAYSGWHFPPALLIRINPPA
jgi:hypothetical protein